MSPCEFTAISTFFVTPGAHRGRHLFGVNRKRLPKGESGHLLVKVLIQDVAWFRCEYVKNFDGPVSHACRDVLVIIVETHLEAGHASVTKRVFVRNLDVAALRCLGARQVQLANCSLTQTTQTLASGLPREVR